MATVTDIEIVSKLRVESQYKRANALLTEKNPTAFSGLVGEISSDEIKAMDDMLETDLPGSERISVLELAEVLERGHSYEDSPMRGSRLRVLAWYTLMCQQK